MERISSSIITAALLVGLMVLPAASQNLSEQEQISSFESSNQSAKSTKVTQTPEGIVKEVSTAFDDFKINISGDQSTAVLTTQEAEIKTTKTPGKTVRTLKTSQGKYKKIQSYDKEVIEVSTPQGTLVEKISGGKKTTRFKGLNRTDVENVKASLQEKFEEKRAQLEEKSSYLDNNEERIDSKPSIDLDVQPDTSQGNGEYVEIINSENDSIDFSGRKIEDEAGTSFTFESATLPENDSIKLYTDYNETEYNWDRGLAVWSESGDTAYLYNSENTLITEYSY